MKFKTLLKLLKLILLLIFITHTAPANAKTTYTISKKSSPNLKYVNTILDLRNLPIPENELIVQVLGYYHENDNDGGPIRLWDKHSLLKDDGGSIIRPISIGPNEPGRWIWLKQSTINTKWFGAKCNFDIKTENGNDDTDQIENALNYAISVKGTIYQPGISVIAKKIHCKNIVRLELIGSSKEMSGFYRKSRTAQGNWQETFIFENALNENAVLLLRNFMLDSNARGNPFIDGYTGYDWQQSHSIRLAPIGQKGFLIVKAENLNFMDPIADHLGFGGNESNSYGTIEVDNIQADGRNRVRSDITVSGSYDRLIVRNCKVDSLEIELNSPDVNLKHETLITNTTTKQKLDLYAKGSNQKGLLPRLMASGLQAYGHVVLGEFNGTITDFNFTLNEGLRIIKGSWNLKNGQIKASERWKPQKHSIFYYLSGTSPEHLVLSDIDFSASKFAVQNGLKQYFWDNNSFLSKTSFRFERCIFRGTSVRSAYIRSGLWEFNRCIHDYDGDAIYQGATTSINVLNKLTLISNIVRSPKGTLWSPPQNGLPITVIISGDNQRDRLVSNKNLQRLKKKFIRILTIQAVDHSRGASSYKPLSCKPIMATRASRIQNDENRRP